MIYGKAFIRFGISLVVFLLGSALYIVANVEAAPIVTQFFSVATPTPPSIAPLGAGTQLIAWDIFSPPLSADGGGESADTVPPCTSERSDFSARYFYNSVFDPEVGETVLDLQSGETAFIEIPSNHSISAYLLPAICYTDFGIKSAAAIAPDGSRLEPRMSDDINDQNVHTIQLPLEAYSQPGLWHLIVVGSKQTEDFSETVDYFEIGIQIETPKGPFEIVDGSSSLLGGFRPAEIIQAAVFENEEVGTGHLTQNVLRGTFTLHSNERGYIRYEKPALDAPFGYFVIYIGDQSTMLGFGMYGAVNTIGDVQLSLDGVLVDQMLYNAFWRGRNAVSVCPGVPDSTILIGSDGEFFQSLSDVDEPDTTPEPINRNALSQPSDSGTLLGEIQDHFTIVGGPVCNDGPVWLQVTFRDSNNDEITGWLKVT